MARIAGVSNRKAYDSCKIIEYRRSKGMTQQEFTEHINKHKWMASGVGISLATIRDLESGKPISDVRAETIYKVCGIEPDALGKLDPSEVQAKAIDFAFEVIRSSQDESSVKQAQDFIRQLIHEEY